MSIRKYIAYLRTVETGSITQAANELGYTQSAVSKMISDLEQDWQVKLLTRNHSGIEISSDGMVLLPTIREIGIAVKKGFLPSTITQLFLQHVVDYTKDMGEITVIRH